MELAGYWLYFFNEPTDVRVSSLFSSPNSGKEENERFSQNRELMSKAYYWYSYSFAEFLNGWKLDIFKCISIHLAKFEFFCGNWYSKKKREKNLRSGFLFKILDLSLPLSLKCFCRKAQVSESTRNHLQFIRNLSVNRHIHFVFCIVQQGLREIIIYSQDGQPYTFPPLSGGHGESCILATAPQEAILSSKRIT